MAFSSLNILKVHTISQLGWYITTKSNGPQPYGLPLHYSAIRVLQPNVVNQSIPSIIITTYNGHLCNWLELMKTDYVLNEQPFAWST